MWTLIPIALVILGLLAILERGNGPPLPETKRQPPHWFAREQLFITRAKLVLLAIGVIGTWVGLGLLERRVQQARPAIEANGDVNDHCAAPPAAPTDRRTPARCDSRPTP